MATAFYQQGMHCVCLNFRGCSDEPPPSDDDNNRPMGNYHLGFTDDLQHYLEWFQQQRLARGEGPATVYLSGFSLGANVVLKCLGELGAAAVDRYHIAGAAVLCAPLDQTRHAAVLGQPGFVHRHGYTRTLLRALKRRAAQQWHFQHRQSQRPDPPTNATPPLWDHARAMAARTVTEFDDAFVAPVYGFADCWDYYRQTSSIGYLDQIAVPTLILNAKDDPFMDPSVWPVEKSVEGGGTAPLKLVRADHGGHLGFLFHQVDDDEDGLLRLHPQSPLPPPSWSANELGQFLGHVHTRTTATAPGTTTTAAAS